MVIRKKKHLKQLDIPLVIVSHDREFLDRLCTKIVETERGVTTTYPGNYTAFLAQKREAQAQQHVAWERQQKEMKHQRDLVARLSAGARSGRASTAAKALERMQAPGQLLEKPFVAKRRHFAFPPVEGMGEVAVEAEDVRHGYGDKSLFTGANLTVRKGERVALVGPNGAGKSTLLRLVLGLEQPAKGAVALGQHGIVPNYFEQNQAEAMEPELTVLETVCRHVAAPGTRLDEVKALLGRMMFSGTAVDKKVGWLSGGEKARLALAKFMLTKGSLLVLDEPTNHLDIPSKETLEEALQCFEGSALIASHDRYFLRRVATRVVGITDGRVVDYGGDYETFLSRSEDERVVMQAKDDRRQEAERAQVKAKSKKSKAEKARRMLDKKAKGQRFNQGVVAGVSGKKVNKNLKRWN